MAELNNFGIFMFVSTNTLVAELMKLEMLLFVGGTPWPTRNPVAELNAFGISLFLCGMSWHTNNQWFISSNLEYCF